jgi:UDP-N-acetylglucosamine 2-epimerase (non-hydrolysing)
VFFGDLELRKPDYYLNVDTSSMGSVMGDTLKKSEEVFVKENPDAVMILGDTNSSVAAIVAERMHIPVYHMEAGNRCFDANVPEELNRRMIDHVASFNLPYNDHARRNLMSEGLDPRYIYATGSPMREVIESNLGKINSSNALNELGLKKDEFFVVSAHRQENVDAPERLKSIVSCLVAVRNKWNLPILVSTHPRTRKRLDDFGLNKVEGVSFHAPLGYFDYNNLQLNSKCVISDSGTLAEEAAILGFSAISLRDSTERPEAIEMGTVVLSGLMPDSVLDALRLTENSSLTGSMDAGYLVRDFSDRVLKILFSTSDKVATWRGVRKFL